MDNFYNYERKQDFIKNIRIQRMFFFSSKNKQKVKRKVKLLETFTIRWQNGTRSNTLHGTNS